MVTVFTANTQCTQGHFRDASKNKETILLQERAACEPGGHIRFAGKPPPAGVSRLCQVINCYLSKNVAVLFCGEVVLFVRVSDLRCLLA
jgi:hypothetical protein